MRPVNMANYGLGIYRHQQMGMPVVQKPGEQIQKNNKQGQMNKFVDAADRESTLVSKFDDKLLKRLEILECETCASRRYQDGSNDPGVSFKSPTHISPEMSGAMVAAHEQEHVVRETAKAESEGREVVRQSVRLHSSVCPECGKVYIAGGVTETVTAKKPEEKIPEEFVGNLVDMQL